MKKFHFIILIFFTLLHTESFSQNNEIENTLSRYFKHSPYGKDISSFVNELVQGRSFILDTIIETPLFYLRGYYFGYNPFNFAVSTLELQIKQTRVILNGVPVDTLFALQIIGYSDSSIIGRELVISELKDMHKQFNRIFSYYIYSNRGSRKNRKSERYGYFYQKGDRYPVIVASWGKSYKDARFVISVIVHLRQKTDQMQIK